MSIMNPISTRLFKEINVWRRIDDRTLIRYRCFQILPGDLYCVKSSDFYYWPLNEEQLRQLERYHLESLFENALISPEIEAFATLEEAIARHDEDFREFDGPAEG